jgi:hypothetical protein
MVREARHISPVPMGPWTRGLCLAALAWVARVEGVEAQTPGVVRPDSVRPYLVFVPTGESWFVAASRGKRMLLDIGRVDLEVRKDSAVAAAYREAVAAASPVPVGTTFTLRAPWGVETVRARAVDTWNGRIVLVLAGSAAMDSAAQGRTPVTASAQRELPRAATAAASPSVESARADSACVRAPLVGPLADRVRVLRDSLERVLRAAGPAPYERLTRRMTVHSSRVTGCFDTGRVLLAVSLRANGAEWTRERMVMIDSTGRATPLAVDDLRFKAHDLLHAVDIDGDGVDDVATIGRTHRAGGTTLLRYDREKRRLVRLAAGFVWEDL